MTLDATVRVHAVPEVVLDSVTKSFRVDGGDDIVALGGVSLSIAKGEFVVIVGHNGSGKSTLLDIVAGTTASDSGSVRFAFRPPTGRHPKIARVRQRPGEGTFGDLTIAQNFQLFMLNGWPSPARTRPRHGLLEQAQRQLELFSLDGKLNQLVGTLSQGQQQILALQLAVARSPDILLLDEHTASLDRANADACMKATRNIVARTATTVIMVTHNLSHAIHYGDTLFIMRDGQLVQRFAGSEKNQLSLDQLAVFCGY